MKGAPQIIRAGRCTVEMRIFNDNYSLEVDFLEGMSRPASVRDGVALNLSALRFRSAVVRPAVFRSFFVGRQAGLRELPVRRQSESHRQGIAQSDPNEGCPRQSAWTGRPQSGGSVPSSGPGECPHRDANRGPIAGREPPRTDSRRRSRPMGSCTRARKFVTSHITCSALKMRASRRAGQGPAMNRANDMICAFELSAAKARLGRSG